MIDEETDTDPTPTSRETMAGAPSSAAGETTRFGNVRIASLWGLVAGLSVALFLTDDDDTGAIAGALLAIFAVQVAIAFALGVRIADDRVAAPRILSRRLPLLALGRTSFALPLLEGITYTGRVLGFQIVRLSTAEGQYWALFESRKQRLAFFAAALRRQPRVKIYRG